MLPAQSCALSSPVNEWMATAASWRIVSVLPAQSRALSARLGGFQLAHAASSNSGILLLLLLLLLLLFVVAPFLWRLPFDKLQDKMFGTVHKSSVVEPKLEP
jgi:hypothetical protein